MQNLSYKKNRVLIALIIPLLLIGLVGCGHKKDLSLPDGKENAPVTGGSV